MANLARSVPRFWTCNTNGCERASVIGLGDCDRCLNHYCVEHVESELHTCPRSTLTDEEWEARRDNELLELRNQVDDDFVLHQASQLNHGVPCVFDSDDYLGSSQMGGMHVHYTISFDDGTKWLMRVLRHNWTSFSDRLSNSIFLSECATLRWLEHVDIPTPKLYAYGLRNEPSNKAGVAYMLIDKMQGQPLLYLDPSDEQLKAVYAGLADALSELSTYPLDRIGSLTFDPDDTVRLSPVIGDRTGSLSELGIFDSGRAYYTAWCEEHLRLIADHQLFPRFPTQAYLIFNFLKSKAEAGLWSCGDQGHDTAPFFLKHMDDKGDHLLVDEDFNLTGIIDWTFARAVPSYEAFGASLVTADMNDIYSGTVRRTERDDMLASALREVNPNLGELASSPDTIRRLLFALSAGMDLSWDEVLNLFKGIMTALGEECNWDSWCAKERQSCAQDARFNRLTTEIRKYPGLVMSDGSSPERA